MEGRGSIRNMISVSIEVRPPCPLLKQSVSLFLLSSMLLQILSHGVSGDVQNPDGLDDIVVVLFTDTIGVQ